MIRFLRQDIHFQKRLVFNDDMGDHATYYFYTYDDGLTIPVFHVVPMQEDKDIAVCLFEPRYYQYTSDKDLRYNSLEPNIFDKVLRQMNKDYNKTNWEVLVDKWKLGHIDNNGQYTYDEFEKIYGTSYSQPDYTKIDDNPIVKRSFKRMLIAKILA